MALRTLNTEKNLMIIRSSPHWVNLQAEGPLHLSLKIRPVRRITMAMLTRKRGKTLKIAPETIISEMPLLRLTTVLPTTMTLLAYGP